MPDHNRWREPNVYSVAANAPLYSTGGETPTIGVYPATDSAAGSMSAADKTKLDALSPGGSLLVSEFAQYTAQAAIAPGNAVKYDAEGAASVVINQIGIVEATPTNGIGTAFNLPVGTYLVDFENSNDAAWSLGIAQGTTKDLNGVTALIRRSVAGSSSATTWIHVRHAVVVTAAGVDNWIIVTPVTGTQTIPTAGTAAGDYIARITFLKVG